MVLGAGLAGLAAAMRLTHLPVLLVEREDTVGGKARSHRRDGFTFDVTGHWLHLRDGALEQLVSSLLGEDNLIRIERRATVWIDGRMVPYPLQANIHGLPLPIRLRCLASFVLARLQPQRGIPAAMGFEDFVVGQFGLGMARHFFIPYQLKVFQGVPLDELRTGLTSYNFPPPSAAEVLSGALGIRHDRVGFNARFRYPASGGIDALPEAMLASCRSREGFAVRLSTTLEEVDLARRRVRLRGSPQWLEWQALISTVPLPELLDHIPGLPGHIQAARLALRSVAVRYANIALRAPSPLREHWVYTPEPNIPFYRMGVYTNAAPAMAPPGCAGLWVEITDRAGAADEASIVDALLKIGAIASGGDVLFIEQHKVDHAYVVFDEARENALDTILPWLAEHGVHSCGRYGGWTYGSMEDAILDGFAAAGQVARQPEDS